jgi:hypothetical protein
MRYNLTVKVQGGTEFEIPNPPHVPRKGEIVSYRACATTRVQPSQSAEYYLVLAVLTQYQLVGSSTPTDSEDSCYVFIEVQRLERSQVSKEKPVSSYS